MDARTMRVDYGSRDQAGSRIKPWHGRLHHVSARMDARTMRVDNGSRDQAGSRIKPWHGCSHHINARMDTRTVRVGNGSRIKLAQGSSWLKDQSGSRQVLSFSACVDNGSRIKLAQGSLRPFLVFLSLSK